jgi:hypothetical protein
VDGGADPLDFRLAGANPFLHRAGAGHAVADHGGGQAPLGVADGIERAVKRQPVEIIRDHDVAHRAGHAVELEEGLGGEIGRGHLVDRLG